jgi:hypothetical protein
MLNALSAPPACHANACAQCRFSDRLSPRQRSWPAGAASCIAVPGPKLLRDGMTFACYYPITIKEGACC